MPREKYFSMSLKKRILGLYLPTFCAFLFLFIYSCFRRNINIDDAWLGEPAFWLAKTGILKSEMLRDWQNAEIRLFFTHKLWVVSGAYVVKFFGYGVTQLKSLSALYYLLFLTSWVFFLKKQKSSSDLIWIFLILTISNSLFFEYSFIFRPDIAVAFYCSLLFFTLFAYEKNNDIKTLILAGVIGAITLGHHLNGVIVIGAGVVTLVFRRKYKEMILFGLISSLGFALLLYDIRSMDELHQAMQQLGSTQDMRGDKSAWHFLFNLLDEQRRYLHSPREISMTLLLLACVWSMGKKLYRDNRTLVIYTASLMFWLALVSHGKTSKYLLIPAPMFLYMMSMSITQNFKDRYKLLGIPIALYFVFQTIAVLPISLDKENRDETYSELAQDLPLQINMLGPMEGAFWAWEKYRYQSLEVYEVKESTGAITWDKNELLKILEKNHTEAIIFDDRMIKNFQVTDHNYGPYMYRRKVNGLTLYSLPKFSD